MESGNVSKTVPWNSGRPSPVAILSCPGLNFAQGESASAMSGESPFSTLALWGGGNDSSCRNIIDGTDVDGNGFSAVIGIDLQTTPQLVTGLALTTRCWGLDSATDANGATAEGTCEIGVTMVNPYLNWSAMEQLSLWATSGYGRGEVKQNPDGDAATNRTDGLTSWSGGLRFEVLPGVDPLTGEGSPFGLALKGDSATFSFLDTPRLAAEVSRSFAVENGLLNAALDPGWRIRNVSGQDDLDAQQQAVAEENHSGGGAELAGRLHWLSTDGSLSATVDTRVLLGGGTTENGALAATFALRPPSGMERVSASPCNPPSASPAHGWMSCGPSSGMATWPSTTTAPAPAWMQNRSTASPWSTTPSSPPTQN